MEDETFEVVQFDGKIDIEDNPLLSKTFSFEHYS